MSKTRDAPSDNAYSHFRCEEAEVVDVHRKNFTVTVETRHSSKTVEDVQALVPYHHYSRGEGIHHLPEVGAICYLAWPSDNTPPFLMGYKGAASVRGTDDDAPERSTADAEGSDQDVSFRSGRMELNPGDIALTTRDDNFLVLRRGGIVQVGATSIAQRLYLPLLNYIRDFSENYRMDTFAGDVAWVVERQESDPAGDAPATYVFHCNTYAQDAKATVRIRHMALAGTDGSDRAAWEVKIAPQGIDRDTGDVSGEVYSLVITTTGEATEVIGASRDVTVRGDDTLTVEGTRTVNTTADHVVRADGKVDHTATGTAILGGSLVNVGSDGAASPGVLGDALVQWLSTQVWPVATVGGALVASPSPAAIAALQQILSRKVFLE